MAARGFIEVLYVEGLPTRPARALTTVDWLTMALGWFAGYAHNLPIADAFLTRPFAPEREAPVVQRVLEPEVAALVVAPEHLLPEPPASPAAATAPRRQRRVVTAATPLVLTDEEIERIHLAEQELHTPTTATTSARSVRRRSCPTRCGHSLPPRLITIRSPSIGSGSPGPRSNALLRAKPMPPASTNMPMRSLSPSIGGRPSVTDQSMKLNRNNC